MTRGQVLSIGLSNAQEIVLADTALPPLPGECVIAAGDLATAIVAASGRPLLYLAQNSTDIPGLNPAGGSGRYVRLPTLRPEPLRVMYYLSGSLPGGEPIMFGETHPVGWRYRVGGSPAIVCTVGLLQYSTLTAEPDREAVLTFWLTELGRSSRAPTPPEAGSFPVNTEISADLVAAAAALGCTESWTTIQLEHLVRQIWPYMDIPPDDAAKYLSKLGSGLSAEDVARERGLERCVRKLRRHIGR